MNVTFLKTENYTRSIIIIDLKNKYQFLKCNIVYKLIIKKNIIPYLNVISILVNYNIIINSISYNIYICIIIILYTHNV